MVEAYGVNDLPAFTHPNDHTVKDSYKGVLPIMKIIIKFNGEQNIMGIIPNIVLMHLLPIQQLHVTMSKRSDFRVLEKLGDNLLPSILNLIRILRRYKIGEMEQVLISVKVCSISPYIRKT